MSWRGSDSRDYIIPFGIFREADLPADFTLPAETPREFAGIFLPQDRGAFTPRGFPPCVVILADAAIWIITRCGKQHDTIPLAHLEALECGRVLLLGWIGLQWDSGSLTLRYNRRSASTVERFLYRLKALWLRNILTPPHRQARSFGLEPNLKFRYAASTEWLPHEARLLQFFQPPVSRLRRRFGFLPQSRKAGDLLMLSDRRLLWITDRRQSAQEPYGTMGRSAALTALKDVRANQGDGGLILEIAMHSGALWSVPIAEAWEDEAKAFADTAVHVLNCNVETGRR